MRATCKIENVQDAGQDRAFAASVNLLLFPWHAVERQNLNSVYNPHSYIAGRADNIKSTESGAIWVVQGF